MEEYISKDALVAEIKKEIKDIYAGREYVGIPSWEESEIYGLERAIEILNTLEVKEVEEEPVSEDLEEEIIRYIGYPKEVDEDVSTTKVRQAAHHFAKWQKEQMMKDAIDVEVKVDAGGYPYIDRTIELYDYDKDVPLAKAGEKVKVIIMKEEQQ